MSAPVRFTFAEDFIPAPAHAESVADRLRQEVESLGYARGFDDGQNSEAAVAARRLADAAEAIATSLGAFDATLETRLAALEAEAADLALSFAQTLTLGLVPDAALVLETFRIALRDLTGALAVTVTVNPKVLPVVDERLAALAAGVNPQARLRLIADRSVAPGDCAIAWPDGAVLAQRAERNSRLAALVARAFPTPVPPIAGSGDMP